MGGGEGPSLSRHLPPYSQVVLGSIQSISRFYLMSEQTVRGRGKEKRGDGEGGRKGGEGEEKGKTGEKRGAIVTKVCFCELST